MHTAHAYSLSALWLNDYEAAMHWRTSGKFLPQQKCPVVLQLPSTTNLATAKWH